MASNGCYTLAHNPGNSPYPFMVACHLFYLVTALVFAFKFGWCHIIWLGVISLGFIISMWVGDVVMEGLSGFHNYLVQDGLKLGFFLFLFSELMFFVSIFWAYFDSALSPSIDIGCLWPPLGLNAPSPFGLPLLGTCILLSSGVSLTWSHGLLLSNLKADFPLLLTVLLALAFVLVQGVEYYMCSFTIADGIYGSLFFFSTGFHGLHVICGGLLLLHCYYRLVNYHFSCMRHLELEAAILYWHFVDVVWLALYLVVYWWGGN